MKFFFLLNYIFLISSSWGQTALQKKFPHGMLTDDYGILTQKDLLKDFKGVKVTPYHINEFDSAYNRWQCFPLNNLKPMYRKWKDADPMGFAHIIVTMCDFKIVGKLAGITHTYALRRAKTLEFCQEFQNAWIKATSREKYICVQGTGMNLVEETINGKTEKVKPWIWNKFKTKKGCHSFFRYEDDCN